MRTLTLNKNDIALKAGNRKKIVGVLLWIVQILLALLFLFAGVMKLVMPIEMMTKEIVFPGFFLRFIGIAEALGGLGLILPGLTRTATFLTPLAAAGLTIIMVGATAITVATGGVAAGIFPLVVGLLSVFVAYSRWRLAPHRTRSPRPVVPGTKV